MRLRSATAAAVVSGRALASVAPAAAAADCAMKERRDVDTAAGSCETTSGKRGVARATVRSGPGTHLSIRSKPFAAYPHGTR